MGTSIYVYENLNVYCEKYKNLVDENKDVNETSLKVLDLFIKDNERLWIIIDSNDFSNKSNISRSITFLNLKEFNHYRTGDELLVMHDMITYDVKKNHIKFLPKFLRKCKLDLKVDRYNGELPQKNKKIDQKNIFFDLIHNRLILILKN